MNFLEYLSAISIQPIGIFSPLVTTSLSLIIANIFTNKVPNVKHKYIFILSIVLIISTILYFLLTYALFLSTICLK